MIQIIGLMIGSYIALRCLSFSMRKGDRKEPGLVQVAAVLVTIGVLVLMGLLLIMPSPR